MNPLKLSRRCLRLWRDVLARDSARAARVFAGQSGAARKATCGSRRRPASPRSASLFLPQGRDDAENQARYALVDFVLDTMPFGGVNGTIEALDMGVPVVTLVGKRHGERTSFSILRTWASPPRSRRQAASMSRSPFGSPTTRRFARSGTRGDRRGPRAIAADRHGRAHAPSRELPTAPRSKARAERRPAP